MITTKMVWNKLFLFGLLLSLGAAFFIGCASTPVEVIPPGTLTITGIPEEFEGKFIVVAYDSLYKPKVEGDWSAKVLDIHPSAAEPKEGRLPPTAAGTPLPLENARTGALIKDGEATISIYTVISSFFSKDVINGYAGSDTVLNVGVCIVDTAEPTRSFNSYDGDAIDARFKSITFENGAANLVWDPIMAGSISITDIPAAYKDKKATVRIGYTAPGVGDAVGGAVNSALSGLFGGGSEIKSNEAAGQSETTVESKARGDSITAKFFGVEQSHIVSYTETGAKDVMVSILIETIKNQNGETTEEKYDNFLFKGVQFADGKSSVSFTSGVKQ